MIARERDFSVGIDLREETGTTYWTPVAITSDMDGVQGRETLKTQCPSRSLPTSLNGPHFKKKTHADCALAGKRRVELLSKTVLRHPRGTRELTPRRAADESDAPRLPKPTPGRHRNEYYG